MVRPVLAAMLAAAVGCSGTPASDELRDFRFKDQPISPAAVHALMAEWSDLLPAFAAVDLEGFTHSEVYNYPQHEKGGWIGYRPGEREYEYPGLFKYRHLGVSRTGTHVLEFLDNGGGTLTIYGAILIRFEVDRVFDSGEWRGRILMVSVGDILDPDHTGTFRFDGRRLTGRDSSDSEYRIDLLVE